MVKLKTLIDRLFDHYGPQGWWPAETDFEIITGAILTQNTAWRNVELAISSLRNEELLSPSAIYNCPIQKLEEAIRPAGFFRQKARKLKIISEWLNRRFDGAAKLLNHEHEEKLRDELLSLWGIGPETADSIILYVAHKPVFVVDAYTKRLLARHGICQELTSYKELQALAHSTLPCEAEYFQEAHALLVVTCKEFCRKKQPRCQVCPLKEFLYPGQTESIT